MARLIGFALGSIWRWEDSKNRNSLVKYAKELDVDAAEITFAFKEELFAFKLSKQNKEWLEGLDYIGLHAPFNLELKDKQLLVKQLNKLSEIYNDLNAKNLVIHPDVLPLKEVLENYNFRVSIENLLPKKKIGIEKIRKILAEHTNMGLCVDVSHAYRWSKEETPKLVKSFKDRISQIHLSGTYRNKDHQSLMIVTKPFIKSIEHLKELEVPIIIEEDIEKKDIGQLKAEVEFIKTFLKH